MAPFFTRFNQGVTSQGGFPRSIPNFGQVGLQAGFAGVGSIFQGQSKGQSALNAVQVGLNAVPVVGQIASGVMGFVRSIFGRHHAQAVALERQFVGDFQGATNEMFQFYDNGVSRGEICGTDAVKQSDEVFFGQILPTAIPGSKGPLPTIQTSVEEIRRINVPGGASKSLPQCNARCSYSWTFTAGLRERQAIWGASRKGCKIAGIPPKVLLYGSLVTAGALGFFFIRRATA